MAFIDEEYDLGESYKQTRINLSASAWQTVNEDCLSFRLDRLACSKAELKRSEFISTVFMNAYSLGFDSFVTPARDRLRESCRNIIVPSGSGKKDKAAGAFLSEGGRAELLGGYVFEKLYAEEFERRKKAAALMKKRKGESIVFFLSSAFMSFLRSSDLSEEERLYTRLPLLLKSVIEEYADMPLYKREEVYFHKTKAVLDNISEKNAGKYPTKASLYSEEPVSLTCLNIGLCSGKNIIDYEAVPFGIVPDAGKTHSYLVCCCRAKQESAFYVRNLRLSRIAYCGLNTKDINMRIPLDDLNRLFLWRASGTPAYSGKKLNIRVRLTENGEKLYAQIAHLRPVYISAEENIYSFKCSMDEAFNYFCRFGRDAEVIEPAKLRRELEKYYCAAAEFYHGTK